MYDKRLSISVCWFQNFSLIWTNWQPATFLSWHPISCCALRMDRPLNITNIVLDLFIPRCKTERGNKILRKCSQCHCQKRRIKKENVGNVTQNPLNISIFCLLRSFFKRKINYSIIVWQPVQNGSLSFEAIILPP